MQGPWNLNRCLVDRVSRYSNNSLCPYRVVIHSAPTSRHVDLFLVGAKLKITRVFLRSTPEM